MQNSNCPKFEACVWLYATYDIVWLCYKLCRCTEKLNVYMGELYMYMIPRRMCLHNVSYCSLCMTIILLLRIYTHAHA